MQEFHFGLCMTTVVDVRIDADTVEEAQDKFAAAVRDKEAMKALPKAVLDQQYEVMGVIEGPLPTPPLECPMNELTVH